MTRAALLAAAVALPALPALAEPKVLVQVDAVYASAQAGTVAPALKKMHEALSAKRAYGTLTLLSSRTVELGKAPHTVTLAPDRTAQLELTGLAENVATVRVKAPPSDTVYSLAKGKSLYVQVGPYREGELWLVLSQPR